MAASLEALERIDQHWAVAAVGRERFTRAKEVADVRLVQSAIGQQLTLEFEENTEDDAVLERLATAYEVAAIEGIEAFLHRSTHADNQHLREQTEAGAHKAYDLFRTFEVPSADEERIFHILHLSALAYCGDRWDDLRRWLKEHPAETTPQPIDGIEWSQRILFRLFDCWIRLLRKDAWDDLNEIPSIVAGLREDQKDYENNALSIDDGQEARAMALRLVSLYHWARASELLATYMLQGTPAGITAQLDQHLEAARNSAMASQDAPLEVLMRWLHVAARRMVEGSVWYVAASVNPTVSEFVERITKSRALFELLPPQRAAIQEQGLLDQASRAIIVELPTSGGKTTLAQFRMLQALNQLDVDQGWVAYVAPTRALVTQVTRRLREDFGPLGIRVEKLAGAVEIDTFESDLLSESNSDAPFNILVATPEKLHLVIRNKEVERPLALVVMDEAHNIEDEERGLRIELLLATIKRDSPSTNFLLLMPYVPNSRELASWLSPQSSRTVNLSSSSWQPNERIVGMFDIQKEPTVTGGWSLSFETLTTTPKTIQLKGHHRVGNIKPLDMSYSKAKGLTTQAGAMAKVFSTRGTSIAVAQKITDVWSVARKIADDLDRYVDITPEIALVQKFLATEISPDFELIDMLSRGVAVHHAGLSDETRSLIEWLAEENHLRVLCTTTTIAQGINFPVSSVFLATRKHPLGKEMTSREFWNLAGRAGRINHDTVGVVGIAAGTDPGGVREFVSKATGDLISRLVNMLASLDDAGQINSLSSVINQPAWADFRSYIAHLWCEKRNLDEVLVESEQLLRNTYGYESLRTKSDAKSQRRAQALLDATTDYAKVLSNHPERAILADATGFAPEGVAHAITGLGQLEHKLTLSDWSPNSLFGERGISALPNLIGVMMRIPEIRSSFEDLDRSGRGNRHIAEVTQAWVTGQSIQTIAEQYFKNDGQSITDAISAACRAIYRGLANGAPWGLSALSKMPSSVSGIDFEGLSAEERRRINLLPAMIYHGVQTEEAVLMRMNSVPRSIAEGLGAEFADQIGSGASRQTLIEARHFLRSLSASEWNEVVPQESTMSGEDFRSVWRRLSGEGE